MVLRVKQAQCIERVKKEHTSFRRFIKTPSTPKYKYVKKGDDEFVCVAIFVHGNLVTKDVRLRSEIEKERLMDEINFCEVSEALGLLN